VKRYEGLFILDTAGKEETIKDVIDKISADVSAAGAKVETVQKMDKRPFARVADNKVTSGFYVNVIFEAEPSTIETLKRKFSMNSDVHRVLFTYAPAPKAPAAA
jgi:small subunit ribosomal protein S6